MDQLSQKYRIMVFCAAYVGIFFILAAIGYATSGRIEMDARHDVMPHTFVTDLAFYDLPRMTVEINSGAGTKRVRIDVSIEVAKKDIPVLQGYQPRMTANLNTLFLDLDADRVQQASTLPWLHEEMLKQVNKAGAPAPIHDVFLRQLLVM